MNTWVTLTDTFSRLTKRSRQFNVRTRSLRRRLAVFLAVVGPGLITSNVDNDAGGFRSTFFVMIAALAVDLFNTVAEFSGIAEGGEMLHVSRYVSVPIAAMVVW